MKLIIDIPKYIYDMTKEMNSIIDADNKAVAEAIVNGIPLPKGHGRLGDLDAIFDQTTFIYEDGSRIYDWGAVTCEEVQDLIGEAPTIIPADKEDE